MRKSFFTLVLLGLFAMPCLLQAEEVTIQLFPIINMGQLLGDDPLDGPSQSDPNPPSPNSFRATIDGNVLTVSIENEAIPYANLRVTRQSTHTLVVNRSFSIQAEELIPAAGMYNLEIQTEGGMLIGSFEVE